MAESKKRLRTINFTPREQNLLFSIAGKYKNIIENKQTNAVANIEKNEAWEKIRDEFNATSQDFNNRTSEQLKRCYENRRQAMRKKRAEIRQECLKTGGGPPTSKINDPDDLILATLDPLTVEGDFNMIDSDSVNSIGSNSEPNRIEFIFNDREENFLLHISNQNVATNTKPKHNWKNYKVNDLKRPLNPVLLRSEFGEMAKYSENSTHEVSLAHLSEDKEYCGNETHLYDTEPNRSSQEVECEQNNAEKGIEMANQNITRKNLRRGMARHTRGLSRRRPTETVVRSLSSSALVQKYDELAEKKNIIADHVIKKIESERLHAEEEHRLKVISLELDIQIKRKQLEKL